MVSPYNLYVRDLFHEWTIRDDIERSRLDFIRTDLGVCLTLATVAETAYSMGHREHANRSLASAEKGYSDMRRYFSQAKGMTAAVESELWSKFQQLRDRLDGLQQRR